MAAPRATGGATRLPKKIDGAARRQPKSPVQPRNDVWPVQDEPIAAPHSRGPAPVVHAFDAHFQPDGGNGNTGSVSEMIQARDILRGAENTRLAPGWRRPWPGALQGYTVRKATRGVAHLKAQLGVATCVGRHGSGRQPCGVTDGEYRRFTPPMRVFSPLVEAATRDQPQRGSRRATSSVGLKTPPSRRR